MLSQACLSEDEQDCAISEATLSSPPSRTDLRTDFFSGYSSYLPLREQQKDKVLSALESSLHFTIKLLFHAYKEPRCNFIVSPFSVATSLGVLALGSFGQTQTELVKAVFGVDNLTEEDLDLLESQITASKNFLLLSDEEVMFKTALYVDQKLAVDEHFASKTRNMGVDIKTFFDRQQINKDFWEGLNTKVGKVMPYADKDASLLLVSAFHIKPTWKIPFDSKLVMEDFYADEDTTLTIPYMLIKGTLRTNYNGRSCLTVVEIPFGVQDLSFLIYLPDKGYTYEGLFPMDDPCFCETLNESALPGNMKQEAMSIKIPALRLEQTKFLRNFLPSVEIEEALTFGRANFDAMCTNYSDVKIALTDVAIKTVLELSPESFDGDTDSVGSQVEEGSDSFMDLAVNRPFFFALAAPLDFEKRIFLSLGYINNPSECGAYVHKQSLDNEAPL